MKQPVLYLLVGFPGSGKTTLSRIIHDLTGAEHIWADRERQQMFGPPTHSQKESDELYTALNARTEKLLRSGTSVVFDTNFSFRRDRDFLRDIAARTGADVCVLWIRVDADLAKNRATHSDHASHNGYDNIMAVETFERIVSHLEPPTADEHPIVLDGTQITSAYVIEKLELDT